jgi:hypothetical protein
MANNPTGDSIEKISAISESLEFYTFFDACWIKFKKIKIYFIKIATKFWWNTDVGRYISIYPKRRILFKNPGWQSRA